MLLLIDAELEAFIWNYYIDQSWSCSKFPVVHSAFSNPKSKLNMIVSSYSSNSFTEVLGIPALKHVVLKAWCKAETAVDIMTVRSVVSRSNTMPISFFLNHNLRLGLCLQGSFNFWQLVVMLRNTVKKAIHPVTKYSHTQKCYWS